MTLWCVICKKAIVISQNPDHYGVCASCDVTKLTEEQKKLIEQGGNKNE